MLSKKEIKYIQSLDQKKHRNEEGVFVAEGPKIVSELMELVPRRFKKIYATESWIEKNQSSQAKTITELILPAELEKISQLKSPNEVIAIIEQSDPFEPVEYDLAIYLDTIQDPGNFGTIVRTADWFGVKHIVCSEGCADIYNSKVIQSTMASVARVNVYYDNEYHWLQKQNCLVVGATLKGVPVNGYSLNKKAALVIGNESKGISSGVMELVSEEITIPKFGAAESLNAGVATGILLSHLIGKK